MSWKQERKPNKKKEEEEGLNEVNQDHAGPDEGGGSGRPLTGWTPFPFFLQTGNYTFLLFLTQNKYILVVSRSIQTPGGHASVTPIHECFPALLFIIYISPTVYQLFTFFYFFSPFFLIFIIIFLFFG